jgi:hypothetical protein
VRKHEYTCAMCKGEFVSDRPEGEAVDELKAIFGTTLEETECEEVCDVCWNTLPLPS